jgi:hypothetical protein
LRGTLLLRVAVLDDRQLVPAGAGLGDRLVREPGYLAEVARSGSPNATDEEIAAMAKVFRYGASPGAEEALDRMNMGIDVRHTLPTVNVPSPTTSSSSWPPAGMPRGLPASKIAFSRPSSPPTS